MESIIKKRWPGPAVRWTVWLVCVAAWTVALLVPIPEKPPGLPTNLLLKLILAKTLHVSAYAFLAVLSGWLQAPGRFRWLLLGFLTLHAAATEILQWLMAVGRTGSVQDVALDLVGLALGVALSWRWWREP